MPPKKQVTEEMILDKAFALTRENGFEQLSARRLAGELHCSTQPIYQTFVDMKGLKIAVIRKAIMIMMRFVQEYKDDTLPDDLSFLIGYVQFANQEKQLFRLIFISGAGELEQFAAEGRRIHFDMNMLIYANGMIMMSAFQRLRWSPAEQRAMLIHAYEAFYRRYGEETAE